ncbi:hypothetical protein AB4156_06770 [Cupriavidus sp. 2MCAB6]|uniref:hypothetical protein n=1 Tax=Cupriavidus sp. 2MCAB6 TaxID=3232981 RepID=UPI003F8F3679
MRLGSRLILCAWQCALLLGGAIAASPAAAQATVTPIDLAAPQARALEEPAAPAASAPSTQAARPAEPASAAQAASNTGGGMFATVSLTTGGALLLAAIAIMLRHMRSRRRNGTSPPGK